MEEGRLRLEATDFVLATLNVASEQHGRIVWENNRTHIDGAMTDALHHLQHRIGTGEAPDIDIRFRLAPHPIHGDSETVRDALGFLKSSQFIEPTDFTYRLCTFKPYPWHSAEDLHNRLLARHIGPIDIYRPLASRFVNVLAGVEVEPLPTTN